MRSPFAFRLSLLALFALVPGCSMFGGGQTATPPPAPAASAPAAPADSATADALAAKVASYRHDVEPQLQQNNAQAAAPDTQPSIPSVANADWIKMNPVSLTTYPQESASHPRQQATAEAAADTQGAATGAGSAANFPLSLPEGADQPAPAQARAASETQTPVWSADELEHNLAQRLRDDPQDMEGQLDYELLLFIEGQPVPQMSALSGLRDEDREVLSAVMDGLSNFRSVVRSDNNALLSSKTQPLIDMADRLRTEAELTLTNVALCAQVKSYGVYKPVEAGWFKAGQDTQVIVYCEVQNFQSRLSADNQWQTQMTEEMTLYTEAGLPVWPTHGTPQAVTDQCRQRRHDFFIAKLVTLPHDLAAGRYLLKLSVTDEQAHRVAEATTPLEIAGSPQQ